MRFPDVPAVHRPVKDADGPGEPTGSGAEQGARGERRAEEGQGMREERPRGQVAQGGPGQGRMGEGGAGAGGGGAVRGRRSPEGRRRRRA